MYIFVGLYVALCFILPSCKGKIFLSNPWRHIAGDVELKLYYSLISTLNIPKCSCTCLGSWVWSSGNTQIYLLGFLFLGRWGC